MAPRRTRLLAWVALVLAATAPLAAQLLGACSGDPATGSPGRQPGADAGQAQRDAGAEGDDSGRPACGAVEERVCGCAGEEVGLQTCVAGRWGACEGCAALAGCSEGAEQSCRCAGDLRGTQRCEGGRWSECADCQTDSDCPGGPCDEPPEYCPECPPGPCVPGTERPCPCPGAATEGVRLCQADRQWGRECGGCPLLALGRPCGPTSECHGGLDFGFPECLDLQCPGDDGAPSGMCYAPWGFGMCTRACQADPDCQGPPWDAAPPGHVFRCHGTAAFAICLPGSLLPCEASSECPEGETCQLGPRRDFQALAGLCMPPAPGGAPVGAPCNVDPMAGALVGCADRLCFGDGFCAGLCTEHADCAAAPNMQCHPDQIVVAGWPDSSASICDGSACDSDADCEHPERFWCDPWHLAPDGLRLQGRCSLTRPAGAAVGSPCRDERDCRRSVCHEGLCAALCQGGDCPEGQTCKFESLCVDPACEHSDEIGFCE